MTGIFISFNDSSRAQVTAYLSIENEEIISTDYYFDINLARTSSSPGGDLYLGNADFIIVFNTAIFDNPTLTKVGDSPGNCTFKPTNSTTLNDLITRANYFDNSATSSTGNQLIINLNGPTPGDQTVFESRVAKIDDSGLHRLGTFKISGLIDPGGHPDLKWKTTGQGLKTAILTLSDTEPFLSQPITFETDSNTCPDTMTIAQSPIISGHYQAGIQLTAKAGVEQGAVVTLSAGDHIQFLPDFLVPLGAQLTIGMVGCQ